MPLMPSGPRLRRIVVKIGDRALELEGEDLPLTSPHIQALIAHVLGTADAGDQAKIDAIAKTVSDNTARLKAALDVNQLPK
jgi:hypothetical protein